MRAPVFALSFAVTVLGAPIPAGAQMVSRLNGEASMHATLPRTDLSTTLDSPRLRHHRKPRSPVPLLVIGGVSGALASFCFGARPNASQFLTWTAVGVGYGGLMYAVLEVF